MNKTEQLKKILEYSQFALEDSDYKQLRNLLEANSLNRARIFIDDLLEEKEIDLALSDYDTVQEYEFQNLNMIQDLIIDLVVNEIDNVEEKQFR